MQIIKISYNGKATYLYITCIQINNNLIKSYMFRFQNNFLINISVICAPGIVYLCQFLPGVIIHSSYVSKKKSLQ